MPHQMLFERSDTKIFLRFLKSSGISRFVAEAFCELDLGLGTSGNSDNAEDANGA